jgi:hypothetical protein
MRQGSLFIVCLILIASLAVSTFGDDRTVNLGAIVLESFDGDSGYEWKLEASKFATKRDDDQFPKLAYVASWPAAIFGSNREGKDLKSLGVWGRFDRRGYNWVDVYPVDGGGDDAAPVEIPVPGRARYFDFWAWGSNLNYLVEIYVRDYRGVVYALPAGSIAFEGWKNLRVTVPNNIQQSKRVLPKLATMSFVKFRIWTIPSEPVDNFYVYFDQLKVTTDIFESKYDGDELADSDRVQELWYGDSN